MLSMAAQLELYEEIRSLSTDMVGAARSSDWERLIELERRVCALREELAASSGQEADVAASMSELDRKHRLIQLILDDDAEVRRHTEPWMEQVRQFLGGHGRRRQMQQAYAASDAWRDPGAVSGLGL